MTIWEKLKQGWIIKKSSIKDLEIDPNKEWEEITLKELEMLSDQMDVTIGDLVNCP